MKKTIVLQSCLLALVLASCNESDQERPIKTIHIANPSDSFGNQAPAEEKQPETPDLENSQAFHDHDKGNSKDDKCKDCDSPEQNDKNPGQNEDCEKNPSQSEACRYPLAFISCHATIGSGKKSVVEIDATSGEFEWKDTADEEQALSKALAKLKQACLDHQEIPTLTKNACQDIKLENFSDYLDEMSIGDAQGSFHCALAME